LSWISSKSRTFSIAIAALVGESRQKLDLLLGEWPHLPAGQCQHADRDALAQHRHSQYGAIAAQSLRLGKRIVRIGQHVGDVNDLALEQGASDDRAAFRLDRHIANKFHELGREAIGLRAIEHAVFLPRDRSLVGVAKPGGRFNERLQDWPQIEGRAADDLEHIGGRGLLLQRFGQVVGALAQLVEQPCVLDGDDGLAGEVVDQLNLFVCERPNLLAVDGDGPDQCVLFEHRDCNQAATAPQLDQRARFWAFGVGRLCRNVGNVYELLRPSDTAKRGRRTGMIQRTAPPLFGER
jgi:hypothetical protein